MSVPERDEDVATTIEKLSAPALVPAQRRSLLRQLSRHTKAAGRPMSWRPRGLARRAVDTVGELAPHIPVRDLPTLRQHHGGLAGPALADRLIRNASLATAGVGAASGGLAAVKWAVPPTLLSAPVLLSAETVAVVAIEVKMVGELHSVFEAEVPGDGAQRALALLQSWARQRGLTAMPPTIGAATVLGTAARKELSDRLVRRFGGNLATMAPMLAGAVVAAYLNRRATRSLGHQLRADLILWGRV